MKLLCLIAFCLSAIAQTSMQTPWVYIESLEYFPVSASAASSAVTLMCPPAMTPAPPLTAPTVTAYPVRVYLGGSLVQSAQWRLTANQISISAAVPIGLQPFAAVDYWFDPGVCGPTIAAPPAPGPLSCVPSILTPGASSACTVTLSKPSAGFSVISLHSDNASLTVPPGMLIANGASVGHFTVTAASAIASNQTANITAAGSSFTAVAAIGLAPAQ
jgi:hypothetical protein